VDLADRPVSVWITSLKIMDAAQRIVWAMDSEPVLLASLNKHEIGVCQGLRGEKGCFLRLDSYDSWIELVLTASQSAAIEGGAVLDLECIYSSSLEHILLSDAQGTFKTANRMQTLEAAHHSLQVDRQTLDAAHQSLQAAHDTLDAAHHELHRETTDVLQKIRIVEAGQRLNADRQEELSREYIRRLAILESMQADLHRAFESRPTRRLRKRMDAMVRGLGGVFTSVVHRFVRLRHSGVPR